MDNDIGPKHADGVALLELYRLTAAAQGPSAGIAAMRARLPTDSRDAWLACARTMQANGEASAAAALLQAALELFPQDPVVCYWFASALWQAGWIAEAEKLLRDLAAARMCLPDSANLLANLLRNQGRMDAAATAMEGLHDASAHLEVQLRCVTFIEECQRQERAAALCERHIANDEQDPRWFALAGNLAQQTGQFDVARSRFLAAIERGIDLNKWFVLLGLADSQRYASSDHPDFALFEERLRETSLTDRARASVLFALGKACDDVGQYERATAALREANRLVPKSPAWSTADFEADIETRIARPLHQPGLESSKEWAPIFIVGLPRTGTTLVAEWVGRHTDARNRGELPTLGFIARRLAATNQWHDLAALREAADLYAAHARQDDVPARLYIDKNPLNFRYLDLIYALFPRARVIHCRRDARDTALSLWSRFFGNEEYAFTHDFDDIATFTQGHDRLMAHWRQANLPFLSVDYEDLVEDPAQATARILDYLDLAPTERRMTTQASGAISSTSRWQARQPVYRRSVQRWRAYEPYLPELVNAFAGSHFSAGR